jgi:predicted O-methyltransferase YrrM
MQDLWTAVDEYIIGGLHTRDPVLDGVLASTAAAGLPLINVSATQGKLLYFLAKIGNARRILEVGTLAGYSTIWMGRALPEDGELVSLEIDSKHAEVARKNIDRAGLSSRVEVLLGPALETLPTLRGPFDLAFIDADKVNIPSYYDWAVKLSRPGSVIIVDNVVRNGEVIDPDGDAAVKGVRKLNELIAREQRVDATTIQTVGTKGYDGFTIAIVR